MALSQNLLCNSQVEARPMLIFLDTDILVHLVFSTLHRDEDMQSLASLMSMKQSDIGNLDDFNDSDDDMGEERRASFGTTYAAHVTGKTRDRPNNHWSENTKLTNNDSLRQNNPDLSFYLKAKTCRFYGLQVSHTEWAKGETALGPDPQRATNHEPSCVVTLKQSTTRNMN